MFIIDTFVGNFDRHNGNWGFIVNEKSKEKKLAPVYDCGSCLYPGANDEDLQRFLNNEDELEKRIVVFPTSAIKENSTKINYYDFLTQTTNKECLESIRELVPKIDKKTKEIEDFINSIDVLSDVRKKFYCQILKLRKEKILDVALERANTLTVDPKDSFAKKLANDKKQGLNLEK